MLSGLSNFAEILKQAGQIKGQIKEIGQELGQLEVEGSAGGGMVSVRMNGKQEVLGCRIDPQVFADHDREFLEDLVAAAIRQALEKSRQAAAERYGKLGGGLNIPGLAEALGQLGGRNPSK